MTLVCAVCMCAGGGVRVADELIRQVTVECAERGLLLLRVRDELRMTLAAYQVKGACAPPPQLPWSSATRCALRAVGWNVCVCVGGGRWLDIVREQRGL
jgi:hypothetical protein